MFNNIFSKTVYEKRVTIIGWAVGMFAMTLLTMSFYPFFKNSGFDSIVANAPKSLQGLLGDAANYKTVVGYVDQQIFALRLPLMAIIMSIIVFVGISVADEDRGTLETLLALPVSRAKVFWQKCVAGAVITGLATIGIFFGVIVSFPIIHGSMNLGNLALATFACWLIGLLFGVLTFAIGAGSGKRAITIALTSALAFVTYLISSMAPAVSGLHTAQKFTPFYYYNTPAVASHGLKLSNIAILVGSMVVLLAVSAVFFRHRDLVRD